MAQKQLPLFRLARSEGLFEHEETETTEKHEVKAADDIHPINKAQLLSYMKLLDIPLGLIINFNELKLTDGVSRLILPGANLE